MTGVQTCALPIYKGWFRISLGNVDDDNIEEVLEIIENSVLKLHQYVNSMVF